MSSRLLAAGALVALCGICWCLPVQRESEALGVPMAVRFRDFAPPADMAPYVAYGLAAYGQSLSVGYSATGYNTAALNNGKAWMFNGGSVPNGTTSSLTAATEVGGLETGWVSMANYLTTTDSITAIEWSGGLGAAPYSSLSKGSSQYTQFMAQFSAAVTRAGALSPSRSLRVPAIQLVHGESDNGSASYPANLVTWQSDLETDIQAATGQTEHVVLLQTQVGAWQKLNGVATSRTPIDQLDAAEAHPGLIAVCGPKYHLAYNPGDGYHLSAAGYCRMGGMYAKCWETIRNGGQWAPLVPTAIARSGATVTVTYHVPAGSITLDTSEVSDPGNYGFEWSDDGTGGATSISSVSVTASDTVTITLNRTPTGNNKRLRYAYTGIVGNAGGPTTGPRGCLHDGETATVDCASTYHLWNYGVVFDRAVPYP